MRYIHSHYNNRQHGFTIVELLVVVVVIGILATITIVAYTGISQRAIVASIQSDLSGASKQLNMFQVTNSAYPNSVTDCPTPVSTNICLKASPGNTISSYSANNASNPKSFTLTATNGSNIYKVTNSSSPIALGPAPLTPVADWLATTQGDHYGNFYDLVTKQYATITRSTTKTIYDTTTQKIYDVPAGKLAINPRSDGNSGSEAVIEESRTNFVTHSYFDNGLTGWSPNGPPVTQEVVNTSSVYSNKALHLVTNAASQNELQQVTLTTGTTYTASVYVKVISGQAVLAINNSSNYPFVTSSAGWAGDGQWHRLSVTFTEVGTTDYIYLGIMWPGVGTPGEYYYSAAQIETGGFATSYIPTIAASVARNADDITVPTSNWNASSGTFIGVAMTQNTSAQTDFKYLMNIQGTSGSINRIAFFQNMSNMGIYIDPYGLDGTQSGPFGMGAGGPDSTYGVYYTAAGWWNATNMKSYLNGISGAQETTDATGALLSTAQIGQKGSGNASFNGQIQRLTIYGSALSDANVTIVTNAVKNGP